MLKETSTYNTTKCIPSTFSTEKILKSLQLKEASKEKFWTQITDVFFWSGLSLNEAVVT
jgi:hypothetical protein